MLARLVKIWTRHDDYMPRWATIGWRIVILLMVFIIPADIVASISSLMEGAYWSATFNILMAVWLTLLLLQD